MEIAVLLLVGASKPPATAHVMILTAATVAVMTNGVLLWPWTARRSMETKKNNFAN